MKKMILTAALMSATMSFAGPIEVIGDNYTYDAGNVPDFILKNVSDQTIKGFKIYSYFANNDASVNPNDYFLESNMAGGTSKIEKITDHIYRVVMTFQDEIKPGEIFPKKRNAEIPYELFEQSPDLKKYPGYVNYNRFYWLSNEVDGKKATEWFMYPENYMTMKNIVVGPLTGSTTYFGTHQTNLSRKRIGLLHPGDGKGCDGWENNLGYVHLETEYFGNKTRRMEGSRNIGLNISVRTLSWAYCPTTSSSLTSASFDYAVLSLDDECPGNSYRVTRHHDAEDINPKNKLHGLNWGVKVGNDVDVSYCFVPAVSKPSKAYPVEKRFGVFANYTSDHVLHAKYYVDDEDSGNNNKWKFGEGWTDDLKRRLKQIMSGDKDTYYNTALWSDAVLAKAVAKNVVVSAEQSSNVNVPAAAQPVATAAAIKGLTREALSVELKTAGDVEVSLVGINGKVFAKFSAQNLQRGINNINWNSTNVPAGHYVVSVKHNGMISGKNVLLK